MGIMTKLWIDVLLVDTDVLERGVERSCYSSQLQPLSLGSRVKGLSQSPITLNTSSVGNLQLFHSYIRSTRFPDFTSYLTK